MTVTARRRSRETGRTGSADRGPGSPRPWGPRGGPRSGQRHPPRGMQQTAGGPGEGACERKGGSRGPRSGGGLRCREGAGRRGVAQVRGGLCAAPRVPDTFQAPDTFRVDQCTVVILLYLPSVVTDHGVWVSFSRQ